MKTRFLWMSGIAIVALVAFFFFGGTRRVLPDLEDIKAMEATYEFDRQPVQFAVAERYWKPFLDSLGPCERETDPMEWKVIGQITITMKSERRFAIVLMATDALPSAFLAFWQGERGSSYRGGSQREWDSIMKSALDESRGAKR